MKKKMEVETVLNDRSVVIGYRCRETVVRSYVDARRAGRWLFTEDLQLPRWGEAGSRKECREALEALQ